VLSNNLLRYWDNKNHLAALFLAWCPCGPRQGIFEIALMGLIHLATNRQHWVPLFWADQLIERPWMLAKLGHYHQLILRPLFCQKYQSPRIVIRLHKNSRVCTFLSHFLTRKPSILHSHALKNSNISSKSCTAKKIWFRIPYFYWPVVILSPLSVEL